MKKETKKAPTIRFRGFTDDWEQRKFDEIASRESSTGISSEILPSVEYEDVISGVGQLNKDIAEKAVHKKGIKFDKIHVLYGKLRPYLHNWINPHFKGIAVGDWWVLKPVATDKDFLYRLIQTKQFDDIANLSTGSKMPRADWNLVSKSEFMIPGELKEQHLIGQCFSNLDKLITLHQRKLDQLKKLKKYFLQNMFPAKGEKVPRIRFKGFTGDWEQHKLSDLVEKICVGFVGTCEKYYTNAADGIPMYRTGDLSEFALNHTGIKYVTREFHKKNKKSQLKYGDILIARHGDSGKAIVYDRNEEANCLNIVIIRPNSARCNGKFLAQRINTFSVSHKIKKMAAGSTQIVINTTDIEKLILQIPKNLNEQAKIISCFISIDNLITFHQRNLNQLQTMKKFMLQNMFI